MTIIMYDLACAETTRRPSPYCWRTRIALEDYGLAGRAPAYGD